MPGRLYLTDQGFSYTAKAIATISGGQVVKPISGANVLTSTNFVGDIVEVDIANAAGDSAHTCGVAINTGVSGDRIGIATTGIHGFYAAAAVGAGSLVRFQGAVTSADAVDVLALADNSGAHIAFGRVLTSAASGQLAAVLLK